MRPIRLAVPSIALAVAVLAAAVSSQSPTRTLPKVLNDVFAGARVQSPPLSQVGPIRLQSWFRGDNLPIGTVIREVAIRHSPHFAAQAWNANTRIVLDNSSLGAAQLTPDQDGNLSAGAIVGFDGVVQYPAGGPASHPSDVWAWVRLTRPFVFTGPHLILDHTWSGTGGSRGMDMLFMAQDDAFVATTGSACGDPFDGAYANGNLDLVLSSSAGSNGAFLFGVDNARFGNLDLPLDLSPFGLTGCTLGVDPLVSVPFTADATGRATLRVPFAPPNNAAVVFAQAVHQSASNASGFATTAVVNTVLGRSGVCTHILKDAAMTLGPAPFNIAMAMLVR